MTQLRPKIHDRFCIGVSVRVLTDFEFGFGTTGYQCTSPRTGEADEGARGDDSMAKLLVPEERRLLGGRDRVLYKDEDEGSQQGRSQYIGAFVLQAAPISPDLTVTAENVIHNDSGHVERNIYIYIYT